MCFKALEFFKRAEPWVGVIQAHHKTDHHFVVFHVIQERAAVGVFVQGPAGAVQCQTSLVTRGINFPKFFDADAVALWIFAVV